MLEDGAPTRGPPNVDQAISETLSINTIIGLSLQARRSSLAILGAHRARLPNRLMLG